MPQLYNPYYETFICRTVSNSEGYIYEKPIIYTDDSKLVRKILITNDTADCVYTMVRSADEKSADWLNQKIENAISKSGYSYINIPVYSSVRLYENLPIDFKPPEIMATSLGKGIHGNEGDYHWCSEDATIYLQVGDKLKSGMRLEYAVNLALFAANPNNKEIVTEVYVDEKLVTTILHNEVDRFTVTIQPESLPSKGANDFYTINFVTNGYFIPCDMPEIFGENADSRRLSFKLFYIGES